MKYQDLTKLEQELYNANNEKEVIEAGKRWGISPSQTIVKRYAVYKKLGQPLRRFEKNIVRITEKQKQQVCNCATTAELLTLIEEIGLSFSAACTMRTTLKGKGYKVQPIRSVAKTAGQKAAETRKVNKLAKVAEHCKTEEPQPTKKRLGRPPGKNNKQEKVAKPVEPLSFYFKGVHVQIATDVKNVFIDTNCIKID